MAEISTFFGIVVSMYFNEQNPPRFHVRYNEYRASMTIEHLDILIGSLPVQANNLVKEWARIHRKD